MCISACPSFSPSPITLSHTALGHGVDEVSSLPLINIHPESADVAQGGSVVLSCGATNANLPVLFTHNGVVIDGSDPDRRITSNNLNIRNFVAGFEGEYVCLARNQVGDTTFTVASAPAFLGLRGNINAHLYIRDHMRGQQIKTSENRKAYSRFMDRCAWQ